MTTLYGFGPVADERCRILVLGSMPGAVSLEKQQYYGHPRNAFWPIMGELFGAGPQLEYRRRLQCLLEHGVALWDVLKSCQRPGSLDADICGGTESPNDFSGLLGPDSGIQAIFFNGMTAERLFMKYVAGSIEGPAKRCVLVRMPSTSPAHAAMSYEDKLLAWKGVLEYL